MKEYSTEKDTGQGNTATPPGLSQASGRAGDRVLPVTAQVPGSQLGACWQPEKQEGKKKPLTALLESSLSQLPGSAQPKTSRKCMLKPGACFNTRVSEFRTKHQSFEAEVLLRPGSNNRVTERLMKRLNYTNELTLHLK